MVSVHKQDKKIERKNSNSNSELKYLKNFMHVVIKIYRYCQKLIQSGFFQLKNFFKWSLQGNRALNYNALIIIAYHNIYYSLWITIINGHILSSYIYVEITLLYT